VDVQGLDKGEGLGHWGGKYKRKGRVAKVECNRGGGLLFRAHKHDTLMEMEGTVYGRLLRSLSFGGRAWKTFVSSTELPQTIA